jgi:hypothetical protein
MLFVWCLFDAELFDARLFNAELAARSNAMPPLSAPARSILRP